MKGIILAGGLGTRLHPLTLITNKHLLPVYNKPMILYPLETLKNSGINEIMIVCGKEHAGDFMNFLGSGKQYDIKLSYALQNGAGGIAEALSLSEDFADNGEIAVILGDNIYESNFLNDVKSFNGGARVFLKKVDDPQRFGIADIKDEKIIGIEEKPQNPKSDYATTGFYLYDGSVFDKIKNLKPSKRGELEITDVHNMYIVENNLSFSFVDGFWSDAGTFESLLKTANWVSEK